MRFLMLSLLFYFHSKSNFPNRKKKVFENRKF